MTTHECVVYRDSSSHVRGAQMFYYFVAIFESVSKLTIQLRHKMKHDDLCVCFLRTETFLHESLQVEVEVNPSFNASIKQDTSSDCLSILG